MLGGEAARRRLEGERAPEPCDFGCERDGACFIEAGRFDPEAEAMVSAWALCGGPERRSLPRSGGLDDQDAGVLATFVAIDGMVLDARRRAEARAEAQARAAAGAAVRRT